MSEGTDEQREAVESRDRDVFLRAGAGTGKTDGPGGPLLRGRRSIRRRGSSAILAFTFTERAADSFGGGCARSSNERAAAAEGEERDGLLEAAEASERAWISTIHGFCRRVLASHPAAAGSIPVSGSLTSPRPTGSARVHSTRPSRRWSRTGAPRHSSWQPPTGRARCSA